MSESRRPDENGYHHRREAGTSPGKRLEALLRRFEVDGILNSRSYTKTIRCSCIGSFFICRDHIRTIVRKNSRCPDRSGSNPVEIAPRHGAAICRRNAVPDRTRTRTVRTDLPFGDGTRSFSATAAVPLRPSCRSGHAAQAGETTASAFPRRSSVCPIPRNTIK